MAATATNSSNIRTNILTAIGATVVGGLAIYGGYAAIKQMRRHTPSTVTSAVVASTSSSVPSPPNISAAAAPSSSSTVVSATNTTTTAATTSTDGKTSDGSDAKKTASPPDLRFGKDVALVIDYSGTDDSRVDIISLTTTRALYGS